MTRDEFVKLAINDPKKAASILRKQARALKASKRTMEVAEALSNTLFITERTVFNDCKK